MSTEDRKQPRTITEIHAELTALDGQMRQRFRADLARQGRAFTHPDVFRAATLGESWADPEFDPAAIDWERRQAAAAIPFQVIDGRPVNPCETTPVRWGRNELGHWGECPCADALVFVRDLEGGRWVLLIEREDGHGWAIPGGKIDPEDADATAAAIRELAEETGLTVPGARWETLPARYVPDPRASDEAWMVTTVCVADLGTMDRADFPVVTGADDARRAAWVLANDLETLSVVLWTDHGGEIFPAHIGILRAAL